MVGSGVSSCIVRGGLVLVCGSPALSGVCRRFGGSRHCCVGNSCRCARLNRRGGIVIVVVLSGVVFRPLATVCVVAHSGVGEGGIAGAAHSVPPGVRSHGGDGVGGIAGAAHNVPPGVLSGDCSVGCSVAAVAVVSFVIVGVG